MPTQRRCYRVFFQTQSPFNNTTLAIHCETVEKVVHQLHRNYNVCFFILQQRSNERRNTIGEIVNGRNSVFVQRRQGAAVQRFIMIIEPAYHHGVLNPLHEEGLSRSRRNSHYRAGLDWDCRVQGREFHLRFAVDIETVSRGEEVVQHDHTLHAIEREFRERERQLCVS